MAVKTCDPDLVINNLMELFSNLKLIKHCIQKI